MTIRLLIAVLSAWVFAVVSSCACAEESAPVLVVHNSNFEPGELTLPAGLKVKIVIRNQDNLPIEFESYDLSREIVVPANSELGIYVGPLSPGTYQFFNDFNHDMQGRILVRPLDHKEK
jgi:hypothetical protein